jgi:lipid-A-disaccharide synthase-like uncharacterized protein
MLQELYNNLDAWAAFGFVFQMAFASRFVIQWIASERRRESVIPIAFWYLSLIGSAGLFIYAAFGRADPVIALGQSLGVVIYVRNLVLIYRSRRGTSEPEVPQAG